MKAKLPHACSQWGSSMGRADSILEPDAAIKFSLTRMRMNGYGCYDEGGAYWGQGAPMWRVEGDGPEFVNQMFIRAADRDQAKAKVIAKFPRATFYR